MSGTDNVTAIVVLDTETTDMDPAQGAEICEIGLVSLKLVNGDQWAFGEGTWSFIETDRTFSPAARGTHHIKPEWCQPGAPNCIPRNVMVQSMKELERPGTMLYAAHNAPFDFGFLPELSLGVIDTLQCARHLFPDAPKFSNQTLRYYLNAEPPFHLIEGLEAHRALYDAACTAAILERMLTTHSPAELVRLSTTPLLLKTVKFGKYEGKPWAQVPLDYLGWMVRASDMYTHDRDIRHTVDHYLRRGANSLSI